ncbi:MAG: glutamine--tRNA ligase, partial [Cyclobacteriaceae bacterium]|nr:glutamine--tRNA ligase [Cyclobacteriaceae bacterium SS2]
EIDDDFKNHLNPDSLTINREAILEEALKSANVGDLVQFERVGYFRVDEDSTPDNLVFNRAITLRDNWAKSQGS